MKLKRYLLLFLFTLLSGCSQKNDIDNSELKNQYSPPKLQPSSLKIFYESAPSLGSADLPAFCSEYPQKEGWQSRAVQYKDGHLSYTFDKEYNRIPDYSYSGYHYGQKKIPELSVVKTIGPVNGDNTRHIQNALDEVGKMPVKNDGHRGALLLKPGVYKIDGTIHVKYSGVVLRGSGDGKNISENTLIYARGNKPVRRTAVVLGNSQANLWGNNIKTSKVADQFVPAGAKNLTVEDPSKFSVGQQVIIHHPSTEAWIEAVQGGGVVEDKPWAAGDYDFNYKRIITRISGSRLYFDAPLFNQFDRSLVQATLSSVSDSGLVSESGIENLRVEIETKGGDDENHAKHAIGVVGAGDSWVQNISARYFMYAGVYTRRAIRITVRNAYTSHPVGQRKGGRFYNFSADKHSQLILFEDCHATGGRHNFISNGNQEASGIVWYNSTSKGFTEIEGHMWWSTGLLFDNIQANNARLRLINTGDWGTRHGWASANSTVWNSKGFYFIQKPPAAQNYGITDKGLFTNSFRWPGPVGHIEMQEGKLNPKSLYEAQLCDRLNE